MNISELKNLMLLFKTEMETGDFQTYPETISVDGKEIGVKLIEDIETFKWCELEGEWVWLEEDISIHGFTSRRGLLLSSEILNDIEYGFIGYFNGDNESIIFETEWGTTGYSLRFDRLEKWEDKIKQVIKDIL